MDDNQTCFLYHLTPGSGPEYDRRHVEVWPEILQLLGDSGVYDYSIFRRGDLVISVLRTSAAKASEAASDAARDAQARWTESLSPLFESIVDRAGEQLTAHRVFRFDGVEPD